MDTWTLKKNALISSLHAFVLQISANMLNKDSSKNPPEHTPRKLPLNPRGNMIHESEQEYVARSLIKFIEKNPGRIRIFVQEW